MPRTMKSLLFGLLLGCVLVNTGFAACTGSSPTWTSTPDQTSVSSCISRASVGDTINVSAGSATWSGFTISKAIILQGAGSTGSGTNISLTSIRALTINKQTTGVTRINGFQFTATNGISDAAILIQEGGTWKTDYPLIIQNNAFILNSSQLIHQVPPGGVIYANNSFTGLSGTLNGDEAIHIYDPTDAAGSWTQTDTFGVRDAATTLSGTIAGTTGFLNTYVETNTCTNIATLFTDVDDGGRIVFRYNTGTNCEFNSHGEGTSPYGIREWEIYNNSFLNSCSEGGSCGPLTNMQNDLWLKGATGVIFNNTSDSLYTSTWGNKPEVYPALDTNGSGGCPSGSGSYPLPHQLGQNYTTSQVTAPFFLWNNTINPGTGTSSVFHTSPGWMYGCSTPVSGYLQSPRDYVDDSTSATKPTSTGTWLDSYTPYTYPHPLTQGQGAPAPPTNLQARPQ